MSVGKKGDNIAISADNEWIESTHNITEEEKNTSLDIQIIKVSNAKNNNMVFYITNQYGKLMPFFTSPIGGVPKYRYKIGVKQ
ncbi:MAG: hypothetical protein K2X86_00815 [Cytophagaceae bacterium]|nr:hypothetical protein [Cytophagaceae bacterium]